MNSSEKLETTIQTSEQQQLPKNPEDDFEIDDEQKFEQHRDKTLSEVESSASQTKEDGVAKLDRTLHSYDLSEEDIASVRQENQLDAKLKSNSDEIDNLTQSTKEQIKRAGETSESEQAPEIQDRNIEKERTIESFQEKRGNVLTNVMTSEITSNGLDIVPFLGGGKMITESIAGKTLSGEKLSGKDRIIHGAMGAGSLALDFTGIGEAKDLAILSGRSVGLVEKVGVQLAEKGSVKGARVFEKTAQFMAEHPELTAKAEAFADKKIKDVVVQIKDYQKGNNRPVGEVPIEKPDELEPKETSLENNGQKKPDQAEAPAEQVIPQQKTEEAEQDLETQEKGADRYREKIVNPEARVLLEKNDAEVSAEILNFENFLQEIAQKKQEGTLTEKDTDQIIRANRLLAQKIIFGSSDQKFEPYSSKREMEEVMKKHRQNKIDEGEKTINEIDWDKWTQETGEDPEITKTRIRSKALQEAEEISSGMRHAYLDQTNASLFAIGLNEQLVGQFIKDQEMVKNITGETSDTEYKNIFSEEDFKLARNRAYYEAQRTNNNVFTHVTNLDNAEKILQARTLQSTSLHSKDKTWEERQEAGQIPHEGLEKSIYMTSGGGGLWYGAKNVSGRLEGGVKINTKETFVSFALLGKDIMAEGKSVQVGSPTLYESGEAQRGQEISDFDNKTGTELSTENMMVIVADSEQYVNMIQRLIDMGYDEDWAMSHVTELPIDLEKKLFNDKGEIRSNQETNKLFNDWVKTGLKQELRKISRNKDRIFATVEGRKSNDWDEERNKIFKWQQINAVAEEKSAVDNLNKAA